MGKGASEWKREQVVGRAGERERRGERENEGSHVYSKKRINLW